MSFIDKDYPIITLPRVNDLGLADRLKISTITSPLDSEIHLGISKSNISTYLINPSPRLIWSYPISPSTVIETIDNNEKFHFIGVTDRRLHKLLKLTTEDNEIKQEYKAPHRIRHLQIVLEHIYVVLSNGDLKVFDFDFNIIREINESITGSGKEELLVYAGIDESNVLIVLKIKDDDDYKLKYKLINKDQKFKAIVYTEGFQDSIFDFTQNHIYRFNKKTNEMSKLNLSFKAESEVNLSKVLYGQDSNSDHTIPNGNGKGKEEKDVSLVVPSEDRILICNNSIIFLINLKYNTILDKFPLDGDSCNCLLKTIKVKGRSLNTLNTIVLYLKLNVRKNKLTLNLINVNIGLNNLLTNMGKKFDIDESSNSSSQVLELTNLLNDDYKNKPSQFFQRAKELYNKRSKKDKDLQTFELETLKYFKGDDQISSNDSKKLGYYQYDITDKNVDTNFVQELIKLILLKDEEGNVQFVSTNTIPKRVFNYLLTHKLYPETYTKGLIKLLIDYPRLLKTCVTHCPNLSLIELIDLLSNSAASYDHHHPDLKLINEVVNKLVEFNLSDLIENLKIKLSSVDKNVINKSINLLIKLNNLNSWYLLKLIMDINGIINLNLSHDKIDQLIKLVNHKLSILDLNSFNLNLINEKLAIKLDHMPNYSFEKLQV